MNPNQKRLFELRLKLNECRKRNHHEVVEEDKRAHDESGGKSNNNRKWVSNNNSNNSNNKGEGVGETKEVKTIAEKITGEEAQRRDKKKKKGESFGWAMYTDESHYNSYQKRTKELEHSKEEYEKQKAIVGHDQMFKDVNDLSYGQPVIVSNEGLDRMVKELNKAEERRSKFSRRRATNPDADINYINERNKVFNKKISRAFDPYTAEIRQNLERGTAL